MTQSLQKKLRRRVVVTGGCGFIGSHLVTQLANSGYEVVVIDNLSLGPASIFPTDSRVQLINADINNTLSIAKERIHGATWIHLAAEPFIPDSFADPTLNRRVNENGTMSVCELALETNARRFILASTAEVYKAAGVEERQTEDFDLKPITPYASSKLIAEQIVQHFGERGVPWIVFRLFNSFGENATHPYFIPEVIRQCIKESEIRVGNLDRYRDFTFVSDTVRAFLLAIDKEGVEKEIFNVGSGTGRCVNDVLDTICDLSGSQNKKIVIDPIRKRPHQHDPISSVADNSKIKTVLGWEPLVRFEEGIKRTLQFYRRTLQWPYERQPALSLKSKQVWLQSKEVQSFI